MTKIIRKPLLTLSFLLIILGVMAQNPKYYDYSGKFKVQFPGTPKVTPVPITEELTMYQFMVDTDKAAYMVSYIDYPAEQMQGKDLKILLDNVKTTFVGALGLTVSDSLFINYGKHKGILFHAEGAGMFCSMRDFMVDNRLYQLGILQLSAITIEAENDFFDSFELVK